MVNANISSAMQQPSCFVPMRTVSNGVLQGDMPLDFALPLLTIQITLVLLVTRTLAHLFKPIKQPRVLAEIIGGVLLGPTALGRLDVFRERVFPPQSMTLLDTLANMGLIFFIFMVGLRLDVRTLAKTGRKVLSIGLGGIAAPFIIAIGLAFLVRQTINPGVRIAPLAVFLGVPLSISAFSVLVRIMAELNLLGTEMGKLAVPIGAVNEVAAWTLLAIGVAISGAGRHHNSMTPLWVLLSGLAYVLVMLTAVRAAMTVVARRASDGHVCAMLAAVLVAGLLSDAAGVHPLLGPFLLGLVVPKDNAFPELVTRRTEEFVTGLMLPLFFASSGLKTNLANLHGWISLAFLLLFLASAASCKITATFVAAMLSGLPARQALILGILSNTKGLAVLIVLNTGRDLKVLSDETFALLVVTCLLASLTTMPLVSALTKPLHKIGEHTSGHNALENMHCSSHPFKVFACAYDYMDIFSMMSVVEALRGDKSIGPIKLYTLLLAPFAESRSAIYRLVSTFVKQEAVKPKRGGGDSVSIASFQPSPPLNDVEHRTLNVREDICKLVIKKGAKLLLLPYHRPPHNLHNDEHGIFHILDHAPCSVGIFVDVASFGSATVIRPCFFAYKIVMLFVGGPDDREALAWASQMASHPSVAVLVVRIIISTDPVSPDSTQQGEKDPQCSHDASNTSHNTINQATRTAALSQTWDNQMNERSLDDEAISEVKAKALESSISYEERSRGDQSLRETINSIIIQMHDANMFVVGKGPLREDLAPRDNAHEQGPSIDSSDLGTVGGILLSCTTPGFDACFLVVIKKWTPTSATCNNGEGGVILHDRGLLAWGAEPHHGRHSA